MGWEKDKERVSAKNGSGKDKSCAKLRNKRWGKTEKVITAIIVSNFDIQFLKLEICCLSCQENNVNYQSKVWTCSVFITVNLTRFKFIIVFVFIRLGYTILGVMQICAVDSYNRNSN